MSTSIAAPAPASRRPRWAPVVLPLGILAVIAAAVVGVRGLFGDPVRSVARDGTATLSGSFEPVECATGCAQGYVAAGARSVFVVFPAGCPLPAREAQVTVAAKPAPDLGHQAYRATACAG